MVSQFGEKVASFREIEGLGAVNYVYVIGTSQGEWVVRFHRDPLDNDDYEKEAWCLETIGSIGVPVPEFVGRGHQGEIPFIVQRFVEGHNADVHRSPHLWKTLGAYCRAINDLPLDDSVPDSLFPRFGRDLIGNWLAHIEYNLEQLASDDTLIELGAYDRRHQKVLRDRFRKLHDRVNTFGLTHGDLVPKNVLLDPTGTPVVIDWGSAGTGPSPYDDFNRIWSDPGSEEFSEQDLQWFAEGYGVALEPMLATMKDLYLLGRVDVVRWAIDHRPDRIPELAQKARQVTDRWL